jgi:phosphonate transport system permease protein
VTRFALLSLFLPGLGQFVSGRRTRGLVILSAVTLVIGLVGWAATPAQSVTETVIALKGDSRLWVWLIVPALVWAWNVWDAARPQGAPGWLPALLATGLFFVFGWQIAEISPSTLTQNGERVMLIIRPMLEPDFVRPRAEVREAWVELIIPCPTEAPPPAANSLEGISLSINAGCASVGDELTVTGSGLHSDVPAELIWQSPIGDFFPLRDPANPQEFRIVQPDSAGNLSAAFAIPNAIPPGIDPSLPQEQRLYVRQSRPIGGWELSTNGGFVLQGIYETLSVALMSTAVGVLVAIPLSFLAARNLMSANALTLAVYVVMRTILNIVRSIESLIIAIIFVVIVGLGPFAGMLAVTVHTIAALAKLFSELIEGIDPGPIEAMRATGANWLQTIRYGVAPQIVPPFTAFTIYRLEINVRASTIVGLVGGGGIGFFLIQWINLSDFRAVSASFIAILVIVALMDQFSAQIRRRLL